MIQRQLKLRLTKQQEAQLEEWLWHLTGVWNWAIKKIELDGRDGIYHTKFAFQNILAGHPKKLGIASQSVQGMLVTAWTAWKRCYTHLAKRPKLKGQRNKLTSIPFPAPLKAPTGNRMSLPVIGSVRFQKQPVPDAPIKTGRIVKRATGWYLCLVFDTNPNLIPHTGNGQVGIDPGFTHLLTLSTGEKIAHPHEQRLVEKRLAQAQRGQNRRLAACLQERLANQRRERNHQLTRRLVAENRVIVWSKDNHRALSRTFGKSVASAGHAQLRQMLAYKCTASGRQFVEVASRFTTKTCSACGSLSGPTGYAGLSVRQWVCAVCGTAHDRDINAAVNTLVAGGSSPHESIREDTSETGRAEDV